MWEEVLSVMLLILLKLLLPSITPARHRSSPSNDLHDGNSYSARSYIPILRQCKYLLLSNNISGYMTNLLYYIHNR